MNKDKLNQIYDILVNLAGADEYHRDSFVFLHMEEIPCREFRFIGNLGFGGKYRSEKNKVDYYSEDTTPERESIVEKTNNALALIH